MSGIGFASGEELWFDVFPAAVGALAEGDEIPLVVRSPLERGGEEKVKLDLLLTREARPLELDLYNFEGKDTVEVVRDVVMLGYRPRGYAPFKLTVMNETSRKYQEQITEADIEHLGVPLVPGVNELSLLLEDALGRVVTKKVAAFSNVENERGERFISFSASQSGTYTGKPVEWGSDPSVQIPASDCVLSNGPLSCGANGGCGGSAIQPPPNDYVTSLGDTPVVGDGILLYRGGYTTTEVDLYLPGRGLDFVWSRTYDSSIDLDGYLGKGWDFSYAAQFLIVNDLGTTKGRFSRGDARRDTYSGYTYQGGEYVFTQHPAGYYDIKTSVYSQQVTQEKRNGFKQVFDETTGLLKSRSDRYGNTITLLYDVNGDLDQVRDTLSRTIDFAYGSNGRLTKVTDSAGREVSYEYDTQGGSCVMTRVVYPATDWIDDTTTPWTTKTNTSRDVLYSYDASARLESVTDGRGKERLFNEYDASGRVTTQYAFDPSQTSPSRTITYSIDSGNQAITTATYASREGNESTFYFDKDDNQWTRHDVSYTSEGSAQTARWDITRGCDCSQPTAIKEPDAGYTTWTIDSDGNVTEMRQYFDDDDSNGYSTTAGSDIVKKAYYAAVDTTHFGACTKYSPPRAFASGAVEADYQISVTYDTKGNPITISYPDTTGQTGVQEIRTYNSYGQLLTIEGEESTKTQLVYYTSGTQNGYLKEVRVKYGESGGSDQYLTKSYEYTSFGARTKETDPEGNVTLYEVNDEFLVKKITTASPFSYITELAYNGNRQVLRRKLENREGTAARDTDNPWWEEEFIYDDAGLLKTQKREISESGGTVTWQETQYTYDDDFRLVTMTDPEGKKTKYTLDERGLRVTTTLAEGTSGESAVESVYDAEGLLTEATQTFQNPASQTDIDVVARRTYDVFDRLEYTYDGASDATDDNFKRRFYNLASAVTKLEEYAAGAVEGTDDPLRRTQYFFDERDRLTTKARGLSMEDTTTYEYDRLSRVVKVSDDHGNARESEYDPAGRVTKQIFPSINGQTSGESYVSLVYDLNGNVTTKTAHEVNDLDPANDSVDLVWKYEVDELDRWTKTTFEGSDGSGTGPNPVSTVDTYDTRNLVLKVTGVDGVVTEHAYDGLGRRTSTTIDPGMGELDIAVLAAYDKVGNVVSRTDPADNVTSYTYDDQNRLKQIDHADGDWQKFAYNDLGRVSSRSYGNSTTTHVTISYLYNDRGLLTTKDVDWGSTSRPTGWSDYDTSEETFAYDGVYRLTDADDDDTRVTFVYNPLDQLTAEKLQIQSGGVWKTEKTVSSTYDATGKRRTSVAYPISQNTFNLSHDKLDRVSEVKLGTTPMVCYWYEGPGVRVIRRDRGLDLDDTAFGVKSYRTNYSYDALERLTEIDHLMRTQLLGGSVSETVKRRFDYTWGDGTSGRIFQRSSYDISDHVGLLVEHDYLYDDARRLVEDKRKKAGGAVEDFDYALSDAQFLQSRTKDTTTTEISYTERADGSLQLASYDDGSSTTCTHDIAGNLSGEGSTNYYYDHESRLVHIDGPTAFWFRYDVLGRRVEEKEGTTVTLFYYDGPHIIEETDSSQNLNRLSIFGIGIDEVLYSGDLSATHRWPLADHLGSVVVVLDNGGAIKTEYEYTTAYGETSDGGTEFYPYGFTGRRLISDTGIYDYRARAYVPKHGRFCQRDPIGAWGDRASVGNAYSYASNAPVGKVDPLGLETLVVERHPYRSEVGYEVERRPCSEGGAVLVTWSGLLSGPADGLDGADALEQLGLGWGPFTILAILQITWGVRYSEIDNGTRDCVLSNGELGWQKFQKWRVYIHGTAEWGIILDAPLGTINIDAGTAEVELRGYCCRQMTLSEAANALNLILRAYEDLYHGLGGDDGPLEGILHPDELLDEAIEIYEDLQNGELELPWEQEPPR